MAVAPLALFIIFGDNIVAPMLCITDPPEILKRLNLYASVLLFSDISYEHCLTAHGRPAASCVNENTVDTVLSRSADTGSPPKSPYGRLIRITPVGFSLYPLFTFTPVRVPKKNHVLHYCLLRCIHVGLSAATHLKVQHVLWR
jgi:hypothetical protein